MRDEHMIERQGKTMVLYSGLLDEAHQKGLKSIETTLHQIPDEGNFNTAIVHARVTMEDGTYYDGIGDAAPHNVGKMIKAHLIRMAETRAKARALRDAVNVNALIAEDA